MLVNHSKWAQQGFSLIELLVVISITAIVASLAAPSFTNVIATMRIKTMASELHSAFAFARSEAMKRNQSVTVQPATVGWQGGWTISAISAAGVSTQIQTRNAFGSGASNVTTTPVNAYVFRPNGRCATPDTFITITSANTSLSRCVKISLSGTPIVRETCS